jgi:PAS domain-containing protein
MASRAGRSSRVAPALDALLVIDAIPAMAWSSQPDGPVELVNRRWLDYTGLSPEESHGWGWKAAVHVEDLAELLNGWGARDVQEGGR